MDMTLQYDPLVGFQGLDYETLWHEIDRSCQTACLQFDKSSQFLVTIFSSLRILVLAMALSVLSMHDCELSFCLPFYRILHIPVLVFVLVVIWGSDIFYACEVRDIV